MGGRRNEHGRRRGRALVMAIAVASAGLSACGGDSGAAGSASTSTRPPDSVTTTVGSSTSAAPTSTTESSTTTDGPYTSVIGDATVSDPRLDAFERTMTGRIEKVGLPGVSLLVVHDGELIQQEAWLDYDLDTVVPIASASKWLTAATVMTLVDAGKIDLDAPISTYLDYAKGDFGAITMRQLLSLTSGIRADESIPCYDDQSVTLDECNRQIAQLPLESRPGAVFRYGGQHMHVAGSVVEEVTGKRFADAFVAQIAAPLGMSRTRFRGSAILRPTNDDDHPAPAGSAESSLGDYGRFLEMLEHGGVAPDGTRILLASSIREMQQSQIDDVQRYRGPSHRNTDHTPYGLGEWLDWVDADGEAIVLSSDGAFGFRPWIDHRNDIYGVYMIQDTGVGVVEGDPRDTPDATNVPTSGPWVFEDVAEALGGSLPKDGNPTYP